MNRGDSFELVLTRWLEDGPDRAPVEPVLVALSHARSHPRRPRSAQAWWRRAMSGITLTHVPSQHTRGWLAAAAAVILIVVAVGGYGLLNRTDLSGAGTHPTSTPALTGGPGPSPSAGVTPRPSGLSLDVLASATCSETSPGTRTETPNVVHIRNATKTCSRSGHSSRCAATAARSDTPKRTSVRVASVSSARAPGIASTSVSRSRR